MAQKYKVNEIDIALEDALKGYSGQVTKEMKAAVDRVTKETANTIRRNVRFRERSGDYVKNFKTKTVYEDATNKRNRWYVDKGHHRLTHLLENGHDVRDRNGRLIGIAKGYPHIIYGAEYAEKALPEEVKKAIEEK